LFEHQLSALNPSSASLANGLSIWRWEALSAIQTFHNLAAYSSFPRKNVTPADSKPGRESSSILLNTKVVTAKAIWIPARAALGRNDGETVGSEG